MQQLEQLPFHWRQQRSLIWESIYLKDATARFKSMAGGYNWITADTYNLQTLCPYETVAYGYSEICDVFTLKSGRVSSTASTCKSRVTMASNRQLAAVLILVTLKGCMPDFRVTCTTCLQDPPRLMLLSMG
jgi:hypothetical protein